MFKDMKVLVLGLGKSGESASELLMKLEAKVQVYDDKIKSDKYIFGDNLDGIELCVVSPGVPLNHRILKECRLKRIPVMSELELGTSFMKNDIIAITGTNGKTTTTMLITEILKEAGFRAIPMGNIGDPVTRYALEMGQKDISVIEVSSFQLETTNYFRPKVAAILNIAPDHLDRHTNYEEYVNCKLRIFEDMTTEDRAVINSDYNVLREFSNYLKIPVTMFSDKNKVKGCYVYNENIYLDGFVMSIDDLAMTEPYNLENVLCALSVCIPYGVQRSTARDVLLRFKPPEYRMSDRGIKWGKKIVNDSKGTNIHSTLAACKSLIGDTALIIGGSDKGEDFTELFKGLPKNIKYVLVTGDNAPSVMCAADQCGFKMITECRTLSDCVENVKSLDVKNVLFSPASASFDRYKNYKERGEVFDSLIC